MDAQNQQQNITAPTIPVIHGDLKTALYISFAMAAVYAALFIELSVRMPHASNVVISQAEKAERIDAVMRAFKAEGGEELSVDEKMKILKALEESSAGTQTSHE